MEEDRVWVFIALSAIISIANAIERNIWSSDCPSNVVPFVETLLPHSDDCGKFYKCLNGSAYPVACPVGLHWSQSLSKCDQPEKANCEIKQARSIASEYNPLCPLDENLSKPIYLPNNIDCRRFYKCVGGYAYTMTCPDGQHWSEELNQCEHPNVSNCQRKEIRTLIANGELNADCSLDDDPDNPTLLPHPTDCEKFIKCSYGRSYILSCPYGLHWDVKSLRCESRFVAKCSIAGGTTTPTPSISTKSSTPPTAQPTPSTAAPDPNLPVPRPECSDPSSLKKFSIPGECKAFLQCYNGLAYRIRCREGREWSVSANDCIDSALAGCSSAPSGGNSQPTPSSTTSTTKSITTATSKTPTSCTEGVDYLSHPTDCTKYIQCDNGNPIERECAPRTYWSKTLKNCQWTANDCR